MQATTENGAFSECYHIDQRRRWKGLNGNCGMLYITFSLSGALASAEKDRPLFSVIVIDETWRNLKADWAVNRYGVTKVAHWNNVAQIFGQV